MQINELRAGSPDEGSRYLFRRSPVIIIWLESGLCTWRGVGQELPAGKFAGSATVYLSIDGSEGGPTEVWPSCSYVELDPGMEQVFYEVRWEPHSISRTTRRVGWWENPAQFQHVR